MNYMMTGAITVTILLQFFFQLVAIAQDSSQSAIELADQMNQQLDCTLDNIPLSECETSLSDIKNSQQLAEHNLKKTQNISQEIITLTNISAQK